MLRVSCVKTKGRQGVHPTPCRAPSPTPATQKPPAERRRPRDARAYIRPLAEHQVPRLPRKSHRQSGGDQGTPGRTSDPLQSTKSHACQSHRQSGGDQGTPGRTSDPLQCTKPHACHAKATGRAAETKGRQGVHPTPCSAPSPTPATQKPPAEWRRPRDARAYIRPLAVHQAPRLPRKRHRQSAGDKGTPGRTSDPLAVHQVPRLPRKSHQQSGGDQRDAMAYIRPLAVHQVPRLPRKSHRQSGGDQGTPGRTSDPLQCTKSHACHAKATGRAAETKGRQGAHLPRKSHRQSGGDQGMPGRTSDPLQSTKSHACHAWRRPRDARAYIRPLAVHQVPRLPRKSHRQSRGDQGTPGRTSDPLQCTKPHACHAKAPAERRRPMGQVSREMQLFMWVFTGLSTQWMWDIDGACLKVMYAPNGLANE